MRRRFEHRPEPKDTSDEARKVIQAACNQVFGTIEGKRVLHWLMSEADWEGSCLVYNAANDVLLGMTAYNEGRRSFYRDLRAMIRPEILIEVEFFNASKQEEK